MGKLGLTLAAVTFLFGCSGGNKTSTTVDGASLLEARCGVCHKTDIPKSARKSKSQWRECVDRMITKGAKLSPEEMHVLVNYLASVYKP